MEPMLLPASPRRELPTKQIIFFRNCSVLSEPIMLIIVHVSDTPLLWPVWPELWQWGNDEQYRGEISGGLKPFWPSVQTPRRLIRLSDTVSVKRFARGARLIVADPRETWMAKTAMIHLRLRPGGPILLF